MFKPVITEKSMKDAKAGRYTFRFGDNVNKYQIRTIIEKAFGVHVKSVSTINSKGEEKMSMMRRKKKVMPSKKAIVTLADKEKIDIFEAKK